LNGIGEKLRDARETRKLTYKEVSKNTNMTSKYIEALENEEFEKFPGETYVIGFLRTYAEFLKLNADEIIQSYKGYKIGESATPLAELTKPTRSPVYITLINLFDQYKNVFYISGFVTVLILVIWIFSSIFTTDIPIKGEDSIKNIKNEYRVTKKIEIENIRNLQLNNDRGYILVYVNEAVQFLVENKELMFLLKQIQKEKVVLELLPGNSRETLEMEKPKVITIPDCPRELVFTLKGLTEKRAKILVMLGQRLVSEKKPVEKQTKKITVGDTTKVTAQSEKSLKIIFEAQFTKKTYVELYLDGTKKRKGIIPAGTSERWEATDYIQIKTVNVGGFKARINGTSYSFGLPGQIANKVITWQKDIKDPNIYRIVIKDW